MKKITLVTLVVILVFSVASPVLAGGRYYDHRSRQHHRVRNDHARDQLVTFGVGVLVGTLTGMAQQRSSQPYYHPQQQYQTGYRECDRFLHDRSLWDACQRGMEERLERQRRDAINRAYRYGRGGY